MVEINNQRKAFSMLAWSEGTDNGRQNQKSWLWRHCRRSYLLIVTPITSQTCHAKPKTQINRRRTLPASFLLVGCSPQAAWPERLLSEKPWRCGIAADQGAWRFTYDWSWWYPSGNRPLQQISGLYCRALVMVSSSKADSLIAKIQRSGRNEITHEQSHRDYLRSGYLHHRLPVSGLLIITVITPLPTKPSATKMPENWSQGNAAITDMQMRHVMLLRLGCKIHEGVSRC